MAERWPELKWSDWQQTADTLHMWTQIVGKTRLALTPLQNHWWNVPLYVSARGLTTSPMPLPDGSVLEIEFDFLAHVLEMRRSGGERLELPLRAQSVADFFAEYKAALWELGVEVKLYPMPVEVAAPIRFDLDHTHASYDREAVERFHRALMRRRHAVQALLHGLPGQDQPGALLLGQLRSLRHALQRAAGRRTAQAGPGAGRGVLARGHQLRLLAR